MVQLLAILNNEAIGFKKRVITRKPKITRIVSCTVIGFIHITDISKGDVPNMKINLGTNITLIMQSQKF